MVSFNEIEGKPRGAVQGFKHQQPQGSDVALFHVIRNPEITDVFAQSTVCFSKIFAHRLFKSCSDNMRRVLEEHGEESMKAHKARKRKETKQMGVVRDYLKYSHMDMQRKTRAFKGK